MYYKMAGTKYVVSQHRSKKSRKTSENLHTYTQDHARTYIYKSDMNHHKGWAAASSDQSFCNMSMEALKMVVNKNKQTSNLATKKSRLKLCSFAVCDNFTVNRASFIDQQGLKNALASKRG